MLRNPGNIFTATNNPVMQPPPLMSQHYSYAMHLSIFLGLFECVGVQQYTFQNTTQPNIYSKVDVKQQTIVGFQGHYRRPL